MLDTFAAGDLVFGDAFFSTYFLLAALLNQDVDAVFEQLGARKRTTDFRCGKRLGVKDHLIELHKPKCKPDCMTQADYESASEKLTIRELKIKGKILITTLLSADESPKNKLVVLYKKRWHVEVDLRNIKTTLGMETLTCRTSDMVEK